MPPVDSMIGHNTSGTALHQLNSAVAGLGLALQDARTIRKNDRAQMVLVARYLVAVDEAAAADEALADSQIRTAGVVQPTDLIANSNERTLARWLARGGIRNPDRPVLQRPKNTNEINDLAPGGLNPLEARFLTGRKFAKSTTYMSIYNLIRGECRVEIRKAFNGGEGAPNLDDIRDTYVDTLFKGETIEEWIAAEEDKRSEAYRRRQELKQASAMALEGASIEDLRRLEDVFKDELAKIRKLAAQKLAEAEARKNAARLTPDQRRIVEDSRRRGEQAEEKGMTDDDF